VESFCECGNELSKNAGKLSSDLTTGGHSSSALLHLVSLVMYISASLGLGTT
jgi:hypothetical protein